MENIAEYEIMEIESVSTGDNIASVSGNDSAQTIIYMLNMPEEETTEETVYTLWDKPLEEYTVSEGLLLIIAIIAIVVFIYKCIKGGFSWLI